MAKTEKELQELKAELEALDKKLAELSDDELNEVSGGFIHLFSSCVVSSD